MKKIITFLIFIIGTQPLVARSLNNEKTTIPVIAMTANVMEDEVARYYKAGMNDFIGKPFDTKELLQKINNQIFNKTDNQNIMVNQQAKIFIVDDEPLLLEMLADYIKDQNSNLDISCFSTGEECLRSMDQKPDLIVLDYHLNSKEKDAANGSDILKKVKGKNKALPVIMLSSQKSYSTAAKTIEYGAMHYVIKGKAAFEEIYQLIKANI